MLISCISSAEKTFFNNLNKKNNYCKNKNYLRIKKYYFKLFVVFWGLTSLSIDSSKVFGNMVLETFKILL